MTKIRKSTLRDGARVMEIGRRAVDATRDFLSTEDRKYIEVDVGLSPDTSALHQSNAICCQRAELAPRSTPSRWWLAVYAHSLRDVSSRRAIKCSVAT